MPPSDALTESCPPDEIWPIRVRIQPAPAVIDERTGQSVRIAPASAYTADAWLGMTPLAIRTVWTPLMQEQSPNLDLAIDALVVAHHPRAVAEQHLYAAISADRVMSVEHLHPMRPVSRGAWGRLVTQLMDPADLACRGYAVRRLGQIRYGRGGFWGVGWRPTDPEDSLASLPIGMRPNVVPGARTEWQAAQALTVARCAVVRTADEADAVLEAILRWHAAPASQFWPAVRLAVTARPARPVWAQLSAAYWRDLLASRHPPVEDLLAEIIPTLGDAWWKARSADDWAALCASRRSSVRLAAVRGLAARTTDSLSPAGARSGTLPASTDARTSDVRPSAR